MLRIRGGLLTAAVPLRFYFGPFRPGQVVDMVRIFGQLVAEDICVSVAVFALQPVDTTAGFQQGRVLVAPGNPQQNGVDVVYLPSGTQIDLPVGWVASQEYAWLGVQCMHLAVPGQVTVGLPFAPEMG
jgi:hypothetical protein